MIPALGVYAALRREAGVDLPFPGGAPRVAQAIDADLLARAIAWAGEVASTRNEIFNITNGDVFVWENIWPAIAASLGMRPGGHVPLSLDRDIRPREEEWETICAQHGLRSGNLRDFVGLSFEYADYTMGYGRNEPGPPAIVSTIADTGNLPDVRIASTAVILVPSCRAAKAGEPPFMNDASRGPRPVAYWNATSAKLLSLRECSRSRSWDLRFSSARRPISRCWPTRRR